MVQITIEEPTIKAKATQTALFHLDIFCAIFLKSKSEFIIILSFFCVCVKPILMVKYLSMNGSKRWVVAPVMSQEFSEKFPEIDQITLQLLYNRNLKTQNQIDEFLYPDYANLHDPFLFIDMQKSVERILKAVEAKEKIVVYGDYDADGVTSSVILTETLKALGAEVDVYIPYRETEGYGLNKEAAQEQVKKQTKLLITVDCGISNVSEVEILSQGGVDVIITDHHHEPPNLPKAFALINPHLSREKYPFKDLTGCGVAFKVACALISKHKEYQVNQLPEGWEKWLLDLVAIGTIADLQPILGENRILVKYGIIVLQRTRRLGLKEMAKAMSSELKNLDEKSIGWQIAPRLNAAGRMKHASTAYELLITEDQQQALELSTLLNQTNRERQQITDKIFNEALASLGEIKDQKLLVAVGQGWATGVVGLVAGRLTDQNHRPSLVISHFNGEIIGSGRSIEEFNIIEALEECREYLSRFGGHAQACGFTVKDEANLGSFIAKMNELAEKTLAGKELLPSLNIEMEVKLEDINWKLQEALEKFEPFGEDNYKPLFLAKNVSINEFQAVGTDGKHLRLLVNHHSSAIRKTIGFCFGTWCSKIKKGDKMDLVFEVDVNEWNGNRELQLKIVDLKHSI